MSFLHNLDSLLVQECAVVTVADVLGQGEMNLQAVHLPAPHAPVRWVATSELSDPTPYLEGDEVLLTTGLETVGWDGEWSPYVERLVAANVAALGLAAGLTYQQPPKGLATACERHALNLFVVPQPTTFVSVSRATAALLDDERESITRSALDAQRSLTQSALQKDDASALIARLAALVGGAAVIVTRDGRPTDGPHGARAGELDLDLVRKEVAHIAPEGLRAAVSSTTRDGTIVVRPLGVRARPEAWLAALVPSRLTDAERVAINTAVSLLSLALERRLERRKTERQLRARTVELLVADDPRTARIVLSAATAGAGVEPRLPRRVRMLRARGESEAVADALEVLEREQVLAAVIGDQLTVVAGAQRAADLAHLVTDRGLHVGIGRAALIGQSSASYVTAGYALGAAGPSAPVRTWDDLASTGVVGLLGRDRAEAFASSFLQPLAGEGVLLETLATFLRRHGSRGETAAELSVHRNTVRNRVEQIQSRLGASLDDPQVRVDAWVALQVAGMSAAPEPGATLR